MAAHYTTPLNGSVLSSINPTNTLIFQTSGKEVLRITAEGRLVFADANEAAQAIYEAWNRLRGAIVGYPAVED